LNEQTNSQFYSGGSIFENKNHSITKGVLHNLNLIYLFVYCIVFIEKKISTITQRFVFNYRIRYNSNRAGCDLKLNN